MRRRHWIGLAVSTSLLSPLFAQSRGAPVFEISAVCRDTWVSQSDLKKIQNQALSMMDVANHPQLVFSSQRIAPLGGNRYQVEGSLNIRGVARPVTVHVRVFQKDDVTLIFDGAAKVRMKDFGLKPPSAALGLIGTKDEMAVAFLLRATRVQ